MSRTALFEWTAVAILLLGCAVATAGVIAIVFDGGVAAVLLVAGAAVALVGAVIWTIVVKRATRQRRTAADAH